MLPPTTMVPAILHSQAATGVAVYLVSLAALTTWEAEVAPRLKRDGVLPDVPTVAGMLTEAEHELPWTTPLTCDRAVPSLLDLEAMGEHRVSSSGRVVQVIRVGEAEREPTTWWGRRATSRRSPEWSELYGVPIVIRKRLTTRDDLG